MKEGVIIANISTIELINKCLAKNVYDIKFTETLFDLLMHYEKDDFKHAHKLNKLVRNIATKQVTNKKLDINTRKRFRQLYKKALLFDAESDCDAFILYIEFDRVPRKRFYQPRRKVLRVVVQDLQDLHDRVIDFLSVSLPVRTGKTTLGIFFMLWLILKYPDKPNLMTGHSDKLTKGMHKELFNMLNDPQYAWKDVFPDRKVVKVSNEDETIDINAERRFPTLTCRSILGTLTGAVDIKGLLYADDLIEDLEESLNPNRLDSKYDAYLNQVKDRKGDGVPELHIGTRWNINDPIGRIQKAHKGDPRYRFRVIAALNENDESNFVYDYPEISFSTKHYRDMRQEFVNRNDMATWFAKFQGDPRVREGLVFDESKMRFYNGKLPATEPTKYLFVDVAWGGGDSVSGPFGYKYDNNDVYIPDWVFNQEGKEVSEPIVEAGIIHHKPDYTLIEANNGGDMYKDDVESHLIEKNYRFNINSTLTKGGRKSKGAKHSQILAFAPDIRNFIFLEPKKQSPQYRKAFEELTGYTENGNVKHDDAADSLANLAKMILEGSGSYEIGERPF